MSRILLTNALLATAGRTGMGALAIDGNFIAGAWFREDGASDDSIAAGEFPDSEVMDLGGKVLMAGGIDAHVHFRDPGLTWKADIESESKAALLGGITSFIDMPNTAPPTTTLETLEAKLARARDCSWANWGFHMGATNENADEIISMVQSGQGRLFGAVKVFMGSSTGNMLVDRKESLRKLFSIKGKRIFVHCEDEGIIKANLAAAREEFGDAIPFSMHPSIRSRKACIRSTANALSMAMEQGTALHVLHVSTAEELQMVKVAKIHNPEITAETSAGYLWFCDDDYDRLGAKIKCNPAIKAASDRDALRKGFEEGLVDTIGSDHAPHLLSEKDKVYVSCPSGVPSVQQSLAIAFSLGMPLERIASAYSEKIASMLGIERRGSLKAGNYADLVVIDPEEAFVAGKGDSKCGWTPYEGEALKGAVKMVFLNGTLAVKDGEIVAPRSSLPLEFA